MDLGDFDLEEMAHQFRAGAGHDQARSGGRDVDLHEHAADVVAGHVLLAVHLVAGTHDAFGAAEVDDETAVVEPSDRAGDQLADLIGEFTLHGELLGLPELLHDRLLGGLGGDPAEIARRDFPVDDVADLHVGQFLAGAGQQQLVVVGVGFHDFEFGPDLDLAGSRVDLHRQIGGGMDAFAGSRQDGSLQSIDQEVAADPAFPLDRLHNRQQFVQHVSGLLSLPRSNIIKKAGRNAVSSHLFTSNCRDKAGGRTALRAFSSTTAQYNIYRTRQQSSLFPFFFAILRKTVSERIEKSPERCIVKTKSSIFNREDRTVCPQC